jgi:hypothetical protein
MKALILTLIFLLLTACDLFTTRPSEPPNQSNSPFRPAYEREIVIENLKNSFKDKNSDNYILCLVDSLYAQKKFSFDASSEASYVYPIFIQGWGINEEKSYIKNLFNSVKNDFPVTLELGNESYSPLSGDSLIYLASYSLSVPYSDGSTVNYSGNLQFNMLRDSRSIWVIYYWKDIKSQDLPSWSDLKGSYYF